AGVGGGPHGDAALRAAVVRPDAGAREDGVPAAGRGAGPRGRRPAGLGPEAEDRRRPAADEVADRDRQRPPRRGGEGAGAATGAVAEPPGDGRVVAAVGGGAGAELRMVAALPPAGAALNGY